MMNILRLPRRPRPGCRRGAALTLSVAMVAAGLSAASGSSILTAQASGACALLTTDEIRPLALKATVGDGVPVSGEGAGFTGCRYAWGEGTGRVKLDVTVSEASRIFAGASPDQVKQRLQASVTAGTADAVVADVGEAAAFRAESPYYVHATALAKGRIVQVRLDGVDARDKKDQVIALLKSAVSRL